MGHGWTRMNTDIFEGGFASRTAMLCATLRWMTSAFLALELLWNCGASVVHRASRATINFRSALLNMIPSERFP